MEDILPGLGVIPDDSLLNEAVFLGCHDEIMSQIFVVHNVLQSDASLALQVPEEAEVVLLAEAGDLGHAALLRRVAVGKVGGDRDGHLGVQTLPGEPGDGNLPPGGADNYVVFLRAFKY